MSLRRFLVVLTTVIPFVFGHPAFGVTASAQAPHPNSAPRADPPKTVPAERRFAFIVGNESYAAGALPTAANDAGLVAQTLQAAGFEVVGARDLDAETLRQSYADFLRRLGDAGQDTVAFVYLAGYALQYANDNYYVPIGANVSRDLDIPVEAVRLSDLTGPLDALNLKARFMVFDAAYKPPFKPEGAPLAGGLALVDASPGSLIAYNAAPGTVAAPGKGNYGVYAQSLAAMLREGGLPPDAIFDRVRLRVNAQSKGAAVPWDSTKIDTAFRFFDRGKGAPPAVGTPDQIAALQSKPLKDLPVQQAYNAAIARDTLPSYIAFDAAYGNDPLGKRVRVLVAVRREAQTWQRTVAVDSPDAYWSYLSRYPRGAHAAAARLRLRTLSAAIAPPDTFKAIAYDVPPPAGGRGAADVDLDQVDRVDVHPHHARKNLAVRPRHLRCAGDRQAFGGRVPRCDEPARLHRHGGMPLHAKTLFTCVGRILEGSGGVATRRVIGDGVVGAEFLEQQSFLRCRRDGQVVDRDDDRFQRILCDGHTVGEDDRDGLADIAHLAGRERRLLERIELVERLQPQRHCRHLVAEIGGRQHRIDAGQVEGGLRIDAAQNAMRDGAAQDHGMQLILLRDVVDVDAAPAQQPQILDALDGTADIRIRRVHRRIHAARSFVS